MRNFITTILLNLGVIAIVSGASPIELIRDADITVSMENLEIIENANYNIESSTLDFTTVGEISVIQIFNAEGKIEFQLPVMSNYVQINKNLFSSGKYKLAFVMSGVKEIHFADIVIR